MRRRCSGPVPSASIFVALGCSALGSARIWALALLVALQLGGDASAIRSHTDEWQQAVALIRANLRPGDTIFVAGPGTALLLAHYGLPEQSLDTRAIANGEAPWYRNFPGKVVAPDAVAAQAQTLPRVWLVSRFWAAEHDRQPVRTVTPRVARRPERRHALTYVSTSAPCSSSTAISRVCSSRKSMTTRVRGARLRRDG